MMQRKMKYWIVKLQYIAYGVLRNYQISSDARKVIGPCEMVDHLDPNGR